MMAIAVVLFLLGCVTVIYPIRSLGISRRSWGVVMIIVAIAISAANSPEIQSTSSASSNASSSARKASGYSHTGSCKTDASGTYRCESETNLGSLGQSSSTFTCRKNPVTEHTDCKWETR